MMRRFGIACVLFAAAFLSSGLTGCYNSPPKASEEEGLQGMDNMDSFEDASDVSGGEEEMPPT